MKMEKIKKSGLFELLIACMLFGAFDVQAAAPVISGTVSSQSVNDDDTILPFLTVTIGDTDGDNVITLIILDTAAKGVFTPASLSASGFVDNGSGVYALASSTSASAQSAINILVFDPTDNRVLVGSTETTIFTISVDDGNTIPVTTDSLTTVISTSINDAPTGAVNISGTAAEDQELTATNTLADADGLGPISYEWFRGATSLGSGATYTLVQADVGSTITVTASYTDLLGTAESVTSGPTATVANVNDLPTGAVTIDNTTPAEGDSLTASNTLADEDGVGVITYQWFRGAAPLSTGTSYTVVAADIGSSLIVTASYTDGYGVAESVSSNPTAAVTDNVNVAPTGTVSISGTAAEDQELTATNTLADADGLGPISYEWFRGATSLGSGATYTLVQADVGSTITVTASYTDLLGTAESVTSGPTATVANVNDLPTGAITIDNTTPAEGDSLTASNSLADEDGLGAISYEWNTGVTVLGSGSSYTVLQSDVGNAITVTASYTDLLGTVESMSSAATSAVANVNDDPLGLPVINGSASEGTTLTVDTTGISDEDGLGAFSYQWFRGVTSVSTASSYMLVQSDVGFSMTVTVSYIDGQGTAEFVTSDPTGAVTNTNNDPTGSVTVNGIAAEDQTLIVSNTLADEDGMGAISYQWYRGATPVATGTSYTLMQADVGNTITVTASYIDLGGTAESVSSSATTVVANVNDGPSGIPVIVGAATEGVSLTVDTTGISDEDGLGVFSYQWYRGVTPIASGGSYTLVQVDVGSTLTVTVSYTDVHGTSESVTSLATAVVVNTNNSPTGSVIISGTAAQYQTLTVFHTLADEDGMGDISYQWYRGVTPIATSGSYTLAQADVGSIITVTASYIDMGGTAESVSSLATGVVVNVNDAPTGNVLISGLAAENQTLTVSSNLADEDGLGIIIYQWNRNGSPVSGATGTSYLLVQADVNATITVTASYTDGFDTVESVTSAATAPVANVNNSPAGEVTINNITPSEGNTLTVSNTLTDIDGMGAISYQWQRGGINISGATGTAYNTIQADVGMAITVVASYVDGQSTAESVTSDPTAPVINVNNPPTGNVIVSGTATEDQTLTVSNNLQDTDGLGTISYQWRRGGINISGATAESYILGDADVGYMITAVASYIDLQGTPESLSSVGAGPVININDAPVGAPVINGILSEGQILSAVTSSMSDADGLGVFSYQWQRAGLDISAATASSYILLQDDVGSVMSVTVSYIDGHGTAEFVTSSLTAPVMNVNNSPTGIVTISGSAIEDQLLTASNTLADVDGLGIISYQWQRNGLNISGATGTSYTLGDLDVGTVITVVASYTDLQGTFESVSGSGPGSVVNVNDAPGGSVIISGNAVENEILTVSNSLSDADGLGIVSYQWNRSGSPVSGATDNSYLLSQDDVGAVLSVTASYTDGHGTDESVTSAFTGVVSNVNNLPTGLVSISGTATEGATLIASHNLQDLDGLGVISYQWSRSGTPVSGATGSSYLLMQADVNSTLTVTASYTDTFGTNESVTSDPTAVVTNTNNSPTGAVTINGLPREDQTLTASNTLADVDGLGDITYEWRRGVTPIGSGSSYMPNDADVGNQITVIARYIDGGGTQESVSSTATSSIQNVNDAPAGIVSISGTPSEGNSLLASHTLSDDDGLGVISYQWNRSGSPISGETGISYLLGQVDVGSSITVTASYTDGHGTYESVTSAATSLVTNVNNGPTGTVTISGIPIEDQILTASNTLADVDGLGVINYLWRRGLNTVGTGNSYTLVQSDVGSMITVSAVYTDGGGTLETVPSASIGPVLNVNDAPEGLPVIQGNVSEGQILTADVSGLSDADGLGAISYQWNRGVNPISGATGISYQLVQADVGRALTVTVSYTDGHGTEESVTSAFTAVVSNVNNPPSGMVSISGTATEGATLLANQNLQDEDGLGNITYQWNRGVNPISGATGISYQLVQADVGSTLTVTASYTDGQGTNESVVSAPTAVVTNTNNAPTGQVIISGTPAEDQIVTASNNLDDIDGLGVISYQWQRNGFNITGAIGNTYTLVQADVGYTLRVTASYTDNGGTVESVTSTPTIQIMNVNDNPTGIVTISGSLTEGGLLEASHTLQDEDGLGVISYQWQRDGSNIIGANANAYTLVQADVGRTLNVIASYIDGQGTAESVSSSATPVVTNVNSTPTGEVFISNGSSATEGVALLASHTLQDVDGLGEISYQWQRNGVNISAATSRSYIPLLADVGSVLTVIASYIDGQGTFESVTSVGTRPIVGDLNGNLIGDDIDPDIDGDGMDNDFENAYGLDPRDPSDATQDSDGDGLTNLEEFEQGLNPVEDDNAPVILPPNNITIVADGLYTFVDFGEAVAIDDLDGVLPAVSDLKNHLPPGRHLVTWSATDVAGNTGTAIQAVNIIPLVEFGIDQVVVDGNTVSVKMMLNGQAVHYPVIVPYIVTGDAQIQVDHNLANGNIVINSGTEIEISFTIVDDGPGDADETIVITMGEPVNASPGIHTVHTIRVEEGNLGPQTQLSADQGQGRTHLISQLEGMVIVSANVFDPNSADVHSYDWSATDNALVDQDVTTDTFSFDPLGVVPGLYTLRLSVSDGVASEEVELALNIVASTPELTAVDSDGDGVNDIDEGYGDTDNDGVPDYLDAIAVPSILQAQSGSDDEYLMATESGLNLSLGVVALQANSGQAIVSSSDIQNYRNALADDRPNVGGLFDFVISGLPEAGQSVRIVLPQLAAIPEVTAYRKLMPTGWQDFVEDDNNIIFSAVGEQGFCPPPGDAAYTPGLTAGDWCVQLLIEDGGPNDADLIANRRVVDPGGLVQLQAVKVDVTSSGGAVFISLMMLVLWRLGFRFSEKK